jgi:hypothetical protein
MFYIIRHGDSNCGCSRCADCRMVLRKWRTVVVMEGVIIRNDKEIIFSPISVSTMTAVWLTYADIALRTHKKHTNILLPLCATVPEITTCQSETLKRDRPPCPSGIRSRNPCGCSQINLFPKNFVLYVVASKLNDHIIHLVIPNQEAQLWIFISNHLLGRYHYTLSLCFQTSLEKI